MKVKIIIIFINRPALLICVLAKLSAISCSFWNFSFSLFKSFVFITYFFDIAATDFIVGFVVELDDGGESSISGKSSERNPKEIN